MIGCSVEDATMSSSSISPVASRSRRRPDEASRTEPIEDGHRQVLRERELRHDAARVGRAAHSRCPCRARRRPPRAQGGAGDQDLAGVGHDEAGDRIGDLLLAGAGEAGEADDLTGGDLEAHVLGAAVDAEIADLEAGGA